MLFRSVKAGKIGVGVSKQLRSDDYTFTYGANRTAGKNKGSVTVTGRGLYGGSVTVKFDIIGKDL